MDRAAKYACFVGYVKFVLTIYHKTVDSLDNVKWMKQESPVFLTKLSTYRFALSGIFYQTLCLRRRLMDLNALET